MTESTIEELCGNYPEDFLSVDISSNPNYIFENDPSYESVTLYDIDENVATVNSFLECEHYVSGGWKFVPAEGLSESFLQSSLTVISLVGIVLIIFTFKKLLKA